MAGASSGDKAGGLNLGGPSIESRQTQVNLEIQVAGFTNGLKSCEGKKGNKDDAQVSKEIQEMKIQFLALSLNS